MTYSTPWFLLYKSHLWYLHHTSARTWATWSPSLSCNSVTEWMDATFDRSLSRHNKFFCDTMIWILQKETSTHDIQTWLQKWHTSSILYHVLYILIFWFVLTKPIQISTLYHTFSISLFDFSDKGILSTAFSALAQSIWRNDVGLTAAILAADIKICFEESYYIPGTSWNPNDPFFGSKRPYLEGLTFKNRGQFGSR